jgi:hypothetical protein
MLVMLCTAALASCANAPRGLLTGAANPPPDVQQACALATLKCAHCHPIERVMVSRGIGERKWQMYVEQMRLKPSSGISLTEAGVIFRCLQFVEKTCTECKQGNS